MVDVDGRRREASIELTRQSMALRARLHALRSQKVSAFSHVTDAVLNRQPLPVKDTFTSLHKALVALRAVDPDLDITDDFLAAIEPEADRVQLEMNELEQLISKCRIKLDQLWSDSSTYEYELVSVFMHRGRSVSQSTGFES